MLLTLAKPDAGTIYLFGKELYSLNNSERERLRREISVVLQPTQFYKTREVIELLKLFRAYYKSDMDIALVMKKFHLEPYRNVYFDKLSGGSTFDLLNFMNAYLYFKAMIAVLLDFSVAIYSFFTKQNSALVFSIVIFQLVMMSGGFTMPVEMMPTFVQTIANFNVIYHMNQLFIAIWNGKLEWTDDTSISFGFIVIIFFSSLLVLRLRHIKYC